MPIENEQDPHIEVRGEGCPQCGAFHPDPVVSLKGVKENKAQAGFIVSGIVGEIRCTICGAPIRAVTTIVPLELKDLQCKCGSKDFTFTLQKLNVKKEKSDDGRTAEFELAAICTACPKRLTTRLANIFRLKKVKVALTGITVEMK